jgi:hypothetical protein
VITFHTINSTRARIDIYTIVFGQTCAISLLARCICENGMSLTSLMQSPGDVEQGIKWLLGFLVHHKFDLKTISCS